MRAVVGRVNNSGPKTAHCGELGIFLFIVEIDKVLA